MREELKYFRNIVVIVFVAVIGMIIINSSNIVRADDGEVYYYDELKVGDIIPYEANLVTSSDYRNTISGGRYDHVYSYTDGYINYIGINFKIDNYESCIRYSGNCSSTKEYSADSIFSLPSYEQVFGETNEFIGWKVNKADGNFIELVPVKEDKSSKINKTPSKDNDFTIDVNFSEDANDAHYGWYKVEDIVGEYDSSVDFWKNDGDIYSFKNEGKYEPGKYELTFKFDANAGDILTFDVRSFPGNSRYNNYNYKYVKDQLIASFDGETISLPEATSCSDSCNVKIDFFTPTNILVKSNGSHELKFEYTSVEGVVDALDYGTYTYGVIRNMKRLIPLNEDISLDTSLVNEGDRVYYRASTSDGSAYVDEEFVYKTVVEEEKIVNPKTFNSSYIIGLAVILTLCIGGWWIISRRKFN